MLLQLIDKASSQSYTHMIITGDSNVKEIDWVNHFTNTNPNHLAYKIFLINDKFLNQLVTEPTRYRRGEMANTLDWILTDSPHLIDSFDIGPPLGEK